MAGQLTIRDDGLWGCVCVGVAGSTDDRLDLHNGTAEDNRWMSRRSDAEALADHSPVTLLVPRPLAAGCGLQPILPACLELALRATVLVQPTYTCLPGLTSTCVYVLGGCPNSPSCLPGLNGTYSLSIFVDEAKRIIDQHDTRHVRTCLTETRASRDMQPVAMASLPDECEPPVFSIIACPT